MKMGIKSLYNGIAYAGISLASALSPNYASPQDVSQGQNPTAETQVDKVFDGNIVPAPCYPVPEGSVERSDKLKLEDLVGKVWYSYEDPTFYSPKDLPYNIFIFFENGNCTSVRYGVPKTENYKVQNNEGTEGILFYEDETLNTGSFKFTPARVKKTESEKNLIFIVEGNKEIKFTDNKEKAIKISNRQQKLKDKQGDMKFSPMNL